MPARCSRIALSFTLFAASCLLPRVVLVESCTEADADCPESSVAFEEPLPDASANAAPSSTRAGGGLGTPAESSGEEGAPSGVALAPPVVQSVSDAGGAGPAPAEMMPAPPSPGVRFVRFVADSAHTGGPLTSIAEFFLLDDLGAPLDRSGWVASADSAESVFLGGAPAGLALDGDVGTQWHTPWFQIESPPPHPHFLQIDLGQARLFRGFRYLPRQDGASDGRVADYRLFVSADGMDWGDPVAAGTLANSDAAQDVRLPP